MDKMKLVILVRKDIDLSKGKMSVQCSHASVDASLKADKKILEEWKKQGMKKVVLEVNDESDLLKYKKDAESLKLKTSLIKDAGLTEVEPGTITCLGIGPNTEEKINKVTGKLKII